VLEKIGDVTASLLQKGKDLLSGLWDGAKAVFAQVIAWHIALPKALFDAIGDVARTLLSRGEDLLSGLWDGAKAVFTEVIAWVAAIPKKVFDAIGDVARTLLSRGTDLIEGFFDGVTNAWDRLKGFFSDVKDKVVGLVGNAASWLGQTGADLIGGFMNAAKAPFMAPSGAAYRFFADMPDKIADAIESGAQFLRNVGAKIIDFIKSGISGAWHFIVDLVADKVRSLPGSIAGAVGGAVSSAVNVVNPFKADGGYFDRATAGIFGEAGPEVILPLSRPGRLRELLAMPEVSGPVGAALGRGRAVASSSAASGGSSWPGGVTVIVHGDVYGERDFQMKVLDGFVTLSRQGVTMPWD